MFKKALKFTGEKLQFLLIFASLASCFTLVSSVGAKGTIWVGNQLEKHEETIDYLASNSGAVFVGLFLFNIVGAGAESIKKCRDEREAELKAQYYKEQQELLNRRQQAEFELQQRRQAEKEKEARIHAETRNQCKNCDFYNVSAYLPCAVHPDLKHNCLDFEAKSDNPQGDSRRHREPVKLEIIHPQPVVQAEPEEDRKYFRVSEFSHAEFLYCVLVMQIDDFHEDYLCERALVERFEELHEDITDPPAPWDTAMALTLEQVTDLQERLKTLSSDDRRFFLQAINTFVMFS